MKKLYPLIFVLIIFSFCFLFTDSIEAAYYQITKPDGQNHICGDLCPSGKCILGIDEGSWLKSCSESFKFEDDAWAGDDFCLCGDRKAPADDTGHTCQELCGGEGCVLGIEDGYYLKWCGADIKFGMTPVDDICLCGDRKAPADDTWYTCQELCGGEGCILGIDNGGWLKKCDESFKFDDDAWAGDDICLCGAGVPPDEGACTTGNMCCHYYRDSCGGDTTKCTSVGGGNCESISGGMLTSCGNCCSYSQCFDCCEDGADGDGVDGDGIDGDGGDGGIFRIENPLTAPDFPTLINRLINFIFYIAIILAPLMIIIAGFYFMTAAGDPKKIDTAKRIILYTIIGLVIVLLAKGLVSVIRGILGG